MNVFWFRRDLRLDDNAGLFLALQQIEGVLPIFIFDTSILNQLPKDDARVSFIHEQLENIQRQLSSIGKSLAVFYGTPNEVFERITTEQNITAVYTNTDYEPYARKRDLDLYQLFKAKNIDFITCKDQVILKKVKSPKTMGYLT